VSLKKLFIGWENDVNFQLFLGLLCSVENHLSTLYWVVRLLGVFRQSRTNIIPRFLASIDTFNPNNSAVRRFKKICLSIWIKPKNLIT